MPIGLTFISGRANPTCVLGQLFKVLYKKDSFMNKVCIKQGFHLGFFNHFQRTGLIINNFHISEPGPQIRVCN